MLLGSAVLLGRAQAVAATLICRFCADHKGAARNVRGVRWGLSCCSFPQVEQREVTPASAGRVVTENGRPEQKAAAWPLIIGGGEVRVLVADKLRWTPVFPVPPGVGIAGPGKARLISDEFDETRYDTRDNEY